MIQDYNTTAVKYSIDKLLTTEKHRLSALLAEKKKFRGGKLVIRQSGERTYFTEKLNGKEYGITRDKARLEKLVRHYRLEQLVVQAQHNITVLAEASAKLSVSNHSALHPQLAKLSDVDGIYSSEDLKWMKAPFPTNPYHPEELQYFSNLGTVLRSKSELIIANFLETRGIPYRYEQKATFPGHIYYPDFTIKRRDGSALLWEHFGMWGVPDYVEKNIERLDVYRAAGYYGHTNLICTYEEDIKSKVRLDAIIRRFILFE